jgi:hypothetical protein
VGIIKMVGSLQAERRAEAEKLLNEYYNYLMDNFDGNASEEAIGMFLDEKLGVEEDD